MKIISMNRYRITKAIRNKCHRLTDLLFDELEKEVVDFKLIAKLQRSGANVNSANNLGWTALQGACLKGKLDLVTKMIAIGANVNQADTSGWTPLHEACFYGHFEIVKLLLASGAIAAQTLRKDDLRRPFDIASSKGHLNIVLSLPHNFPDMTMSWPAIYIAAYLGDIQTIKNYRHGIDECNSYDWTPLRLAALNGQKTAIQVLLQMGAEVNQVNHHGRTPLHIAAFYNQVDAMKELIVGGANVESKDFWGRTPLHSTIFSIHTPLAGAEYLLSLRANINIQDVEGKTPLHHAVLQSSNSSWTIAKFLIDRGANINSQDDEGNTPLHFCRFTARENALPFAQLLIEKGANIDLQNNDGISPRNIFEGRNSPKIKAIMELLTQFC